MDTFWRDLRYGLRRLRRSPGFTAAALLTLMVGIGLNSAMFSLVNAVLLQPLPYPDAERLFMVWGQYPRLGYNQLPASEPEVLDFRQQSQLFEDLAAYTDAQVTLNSDQEPVKLRAARTTASLFAVLRQQAALGRTLQPEDDQPGRNRVVVLSHTLWLSSFGADPALLGQYLNLDGEPHLVAGVMPPGFDFPERTELWLPLALDPANLQLRNVHYLRVLARIKPGFTHAQADEEVKAIAYRFKQQDPANYPTESLYNLQLVPLREQIVSRVRPAFLVLLGTVACVLLIACTNVTNLLLIRAQASEREVAVRRAFGVSRWGLLRQHLTETLLLTGTGGALGLLAAYWSMRALAVLYRADIPRAEGIGIDGRVLAFTMLLVVGVGVILALIVAWRGHHVDVPEALKEGAGHATSGAASQTVRSMLLIAEVALALVLLVGAGLMLSSLQQLRKVDLGFRAEGLLTLGVSLDEQNYPQPSQVVAFYDRLLQNLQAAPELGLPALVNKVPFGEPAVETTFAIEGRPFSHDTGELPPTAAVLSVNADYFRTMNIPLLAGRSLSPGDHADAPPVVVLDQVAAQRFWSSESPIGRRIKLGSHMSTAPWLEIVGVVGAIKDSRLDTESKAHVYLPYPQQPEHEMALALRSNLDPAAQVSRVRQAVLENDRSVPLYDVRAMPERVAGSMVTERLAAVLLSLFAGVALALAAIGLYGVIAYNVQLRRAEIGIRMALGAQRGQIFQAVISQGLTLSLIGVAVGIVAALGLSRLLAGLLFGISSQDPATLLGASLVLLGVATLASLLPAHRATQVSPNTVLRSE